MAVSIEHGRVLEGCVLGHLMLRHAIAVSLGLVLALGLAAAPVPAATAPGEAPADSTALSAGQEKLVSHMVLPIIFYTPETAFGAGLAAGYFFKEAPGDRPNSISGLATVTSKGQTALTLTTETYSPDGSHHLSGNVSAQKFPYSFWGIGNSTPDSLEETYTPRTAKFSMLAERRFLSKLTFGGQYSFWYESVTEVEDGGRLDSGEIRGSSGGYSSGLGIVSTWDGRDNVYFTRQGFYTQSRAAYFDPALGSTYEYGVVDLDIRYFTPLFGGHSLGLWGVLRATSGDPPFQSMPGIGGSSFLRGYPGRRYIDMVAATADAEFRTAYFRRFSFVAFGSLGRVAGRLGDLHDERMRYTAGAGLRFRLNDENFNLRVDFGFGEGTNGFYLVAGEAF